MGFACLQNLLNQLLTVDLPAMMVLPERLEISVPPSVTSIAEAAVGRDTIMRAVASAVLQVGCSSQQRGGTPVSGAFSVAKIASKQRRGGRGARHHHARSSKRSAAGGLLVTAWGCHWCM
jgi:hypothetical protein